MSLWQKLMALRTALNYGEQLSNVATWKQRASRLNSLVGLLTALLPFVPGLENVDHEIIIDVAVGIGGFFGLFNAYMYNATSTRVGL